MESITLASGYEMPSLGLGTWQMKGSECKNAVQKAIEMGYNHIDTAYAYDNQKVIGEALKEMDVDRSHLFITTKIWRDHLEYDAAISQANECLEQLQTDYVDLLLIHWPSDEGVPLEDTLGAFNKLHEQDKVRSLGVSNFNIALVDEAQEISDAPISVNQVKFHPKHVSEELLEHHKQNDVVITAYSPLGRADILDNPVLTEIADAHDRTPAQVTLRWLLQKGTIVIPKASSEAHLKENFDIFGWELSSDEMQRIDGLSDDS